MTRMHRLSGLLTTLLLVGALLSACGSDDDPTATVAQQTPESSGASLTEVVVGYVPVLIYAPVILAKEKGYFEAQGLDVTLEPLAGGSDMVVLTANGDYNIGIGGTGPAYFNAAQRGIDLKIIGPLHFEREPQATPLMVSKARYDTGELTSVSDLAGRKVSVNARGATEYWLDTALRTEGLTIEDVDLQTLGFADVPAALESGALDAAMLGEPLATQAERNGIAVRLDTDFPANFQPTFIWVNPDFARDHPDLTTGFMAGMMLGCRDLWSDDWDSDENLAILNQYTNVPADLIREAARTYCEPNGDVSLDDLATLQQFFADRGLLEYDALLDVETLVDRMFADRARDEVGSFEFD
ncbi:MAG TPA: ABC transporter substrate-binding protein [Thermomicrobiales bacterium]|nr:ABC transporter substrate-binding protein [Thermomicrobiales bacterium]